MKTIIACLLTVVVGVSSFSSISTTTVFACTGGGYYTINKALDEASLVVSGYFVEFDDVKRNGVFEVEEYLVGQSGAKYLLMELTPHRYIEHMKQGRQEEGTCGIPLTPLPNLYTKGFLALNRQNNGAYSAVWVGSEQIGYFSSYNIVDNGTIRVFGNFLPDPSVPTMLQFSYHGLRAYILQITESTAVKPSLDYPYPRTTPILLTTDEGTRYILPVDGQSPYMISPRDFDRQFPKSSCIEPPCRIGSPNQLDSVAVFRDAIQLEQYNQRYMATIMLIGDMGTFSPTSDLFALWKDNEIQIHALFYPRLGLGTRVISETQIINQVQLNLKDTDSMSLGVWSPDGRYLTYSDHVGLWLWDVLSPRLIPDLLVPTISYDVPTPRYFSPMGRFLAVTEGNIRYTLDVRNGMRYPDGVVSPDDRILLAYDTSQEYNIDPVQMWLTPFQSEQIGFEIYEVRQVAWLDESQYLTTHYITRVYTNETDYTPIPRTPVLWTGDTGIPLAFGRPYFENTDQIIGAYTFDYHRPTKSMLTVASPTSISINGEIHEYGQYLDGDLVNAEWLPSLFYYKDE